MIKETLSEPSTWAGLGLLATGIGSIAAGDYNTGIPQVIAGLAAILRREAKQK